MKTQEESREELTKLGLISLSIEHHETIPNMLIFIRSIINITLTFQNKFIHQLVFCIMINLI